MEDVQAIQPVLKKLVSDYTLRNYIIFLLLPCHERTFKIVFKHAYVFFTTAQQKGKMMSNEQELKRLSDIIEITHVVNRIGPYGDQGRWEEQRSLFTDEITIDFGPVKPPSTVTTADNITWAKKAYSGITTHHMITNTYVSLDGDSAHVSAQGLARHYRTADAGFWNIYQRYEFGLIRTSVGWKVNRLKMEPIFEEGNARLLEVKE